MNAGIAGCGIAGAGRYLIVESPAIVSGYANLRTDAHPVAFGSDQFEQDPVIVRFGDIAEHADRGAESCDHEIHTPVVVEVSIGEAAVRGKPGEIGPSRGAHICKLPVTEIAKDGVRFGIVKMPGDFARYCPAHCCGLPPGPSSRHCRDLRCRLTSRTWAWSDSRAGSVGRH